MFAMIGIAFLSIFIYFVVAKLVIGGRWSTGMMLGGFDNWMAGGTMYTTEGLSIGSVYSPGSLFLAMITRIFFGYSAETAIIVIGGLFILLTLWAYASLSDESLAKRYSLFLICSFFFIIQFPWVRSYSLEMHPDIPCLMFFVWGVVYVGKYLKANNSVFLIVSSILMYCSGIFKANAIFLFVGIGIYVLFSTKIQWKQKWPILLAELIAGIGVLITMLSFAGCLYNSVIVMSTHPLVGFDEYLTYISDAIRRDGIFILLLFVSSFLLLRKVLRFKSVVEEMWVCGAVLWFLFGLYGAAKVGSNCGNIEASLVALLPVILPTVEMVYSKLSHATLFEKLRNRRFFITSTSIVCVISCIVVILFSVNRTFSKFCLFQERLEHQTQFANWLNTHYPGRNIAFNASEYELLNGANVKKKSDFHMAEHYFFGGLLSDKDLAALSKKEEWEIIVTTPDIVDKRWPETFSAFKKLGMDEYPGFEMGDQWVEVFVKE